MLEKYLNDYYTLKVSMNEIVKKENISNTKFYNFIKKKNLVSTRVYYRMIDLGDEELNRVLKDKYSSIVKRCNGNAGTHATKSYENMEYMPIYKWVEFCLRNKDVILELWKVYQTSGKDIRLAISIDRLDNSKGYAEGNLEFVSYSFNSWKRNLRPIKVVAEEVESHFFSCEEASEFFGLRRQYIGELLRGVKTSEKYNVLSSDVEEVLSKNNTTDLKEYHSTIFRRRL